MASYPAVEVAWARAGDHDAIVDLLYAALDRFHPVAIEPRLEPSVNSLDLEEIWRVFFRYADERACAAESLREEFAGRLTRVVTVDVPDAGWAQRSQENLRAVQIGRVVVAPPWDQREFSGADITIVINPSTGFGTGHHETTRLCLLLIQQLELADRTVIDVGTGSGVLAIAAAKSGAGRVVAVDNDPDAVRNARENLLANGCEDVIEVVEGDLASLSRPPADIVVANLTAGVIQQNSAALARLVRPGGLLLLSGFGPRDLDELTAAFPGLTRREVRHEGDWIALSLG